MRWNLITVPSAPAPAYEPSRDHRRRGSREPAVVHAPVSTKAPSSAAEALDRIHFPPEAIDRISRTPDSWLFAGGVRRGAWPGNRPRHGLRRPHPLTPDLRRFASGDAKIDRLGFQSLPVEKAASHCRAGERRKQYEMLEDRADGAPCFDSSPASRLLGPWWRRPDLRWRRPGRPRPLTLSCRSLRAAPPTSCRASCSRTCRREPVIPSSSTTGPVVAAPSA